MSMEDATDTLSDWTYSEAFGLGGIVTKRLEYFLTSGEDIPLPSFPVIKISFL